MPKSNFQKFMSNNTLMLSQCVTQARLKRAGAIICKDMFDEGFVSYEKRKFPKWMRDFAAAQLRAFDKEAEYHKNRKGQ